MSADLMRVLLLASVLCLAGCIVPVPYASRKTPEVSGRIVDSTTHEPLAGAQLCFFYENTEVTSGGGASNQTGAFHLRPTHNFHLFTWFGGMCNTWSWPDGPFYDHLRIRRHGYRDLNLDLQEEFKRRHLDRPDEFMGEWLSCYDRLLPLGDVPMRRM